MTETRFDYFVGTCVLEVEEIGSGSLILAVSLYSDVIVDVVSYGMQCSANPLLAIRSAYRS